MKRAVAVVVAVAALASSASGQWTNWNSGPGHNGHFYKAVAAGGGITWSNAMAAAQATGGYLACIGSAEENAFVFSLIGSAEFWSGNFGPWLGGIQTNKASEPAGHWSWATGEPWLFSNWAGGQPDDWLNAEDYVQFYPAASPTWNDMDNDSATPVAYVIEHEAPTIAGIEWGADTVSLALTNLILGLTSTIQRTSALLPTEWTNDSQFLTVTGGTNVSIGATNETQFYRFLQH